MSVRSCVMCKHSFEGTTNQKHCSVTCRFLEKVEFSDGCWTWKGWSTREGYGQIWDGRCVMAHRWSYENLVAPIPPGLVIDHLCRNPSCVNPDHLEPVTNRENGMRGLTPYGVLRTTCVRGHDVTDPSNVRVTSQGKKQCRACDRIRSQNQRDRAKALR